jgi:hypothetical protein
MGGQRAESPREIDVIFSWSSGASRGMDSPVALSAATYGALMRAVRTAATGENFDGLCAYDRRRRRIESDEDVVRAVERGGGIFFVGTETPNGSYIDRL